MKKAFLPVFFIWTVLILQGCSNNPPEILQNYWQLTLVQQAGDEGSGSGSAGYREELSVFTLSRDEDGENEIESIFLIQDEEELFWELDAGNWEEAEIQGEKWKGASSLQMPGSTPFPRKSYRLLVIDKSGQRAEKTIAVSLKKVIELPVFPVLAKGEGGWVIESPFSTHTIRCYDKNGELKGEVKVNEKNIADRFLRDKLKPSTGDTIVITGNDSSKGWMVQALPVIY